LLSERAGGRTGQSHRRTRPTTPWDRPGACATLPPGKWAAGCVGQPRHCRASGRVVVRTGQPRVPLGRACYTTSRRAGARVVGLLSRTATPPLARHDFAVIPNKRKNRRTKKLPVHRSTKTPKCYTSSRCVCVSS